MKRLTTKMFRQFGIGNHGDISPEAPWNDAFLKYGIHIIDLWSDEEGAMLSDFLSIPNSNFPRKVAFYDKNSVLGPLPTGLVIERINRAAELLGILED